MHITLEDTHTRLNTGVLIPKIGFGTWQLADGREAYNATQNALAAGYRLIDTAAIYGNEESVGQAIADSGVPREEIFLTTKLWTADQGHERAKSAFENSLYRLDLDHIDLYLIHWPGRDPELRHESWAMLEKLYREGRAHNIGVSNFSVDQLEDLHEVAHLVPAVNQIEFHPFNYKQQRDILEYCHVHGIAVEAYSPLARGHKINEQTITDLADKYEKTPAQIMLRWCLQHDTIPIPKSTNPKHIISNLEIFDFRLSNEDVVSLDHLSEGYSVVN